MANYLDLNGTTDVVGRLKAKIAEKASNDDVQLIVDEVTLKADISKIGKINGQTIYDNGDITVSGSDGHFKYNTDSVDDNNGIVVNPTAVPKWTKIKGTSFTLTKDIKYYMNFNENGDYTLFYYTDGTEYTSFTITDGVISDFTSGKTDLLFGSGILYDKDGNRITDKTQSYKLSEIYIKHNSNNTFIISCYSDFVLSTVEYGIVESGAYSVVDGSFLKLSTTDYVDEKIGDINNILTSIIG